jgi:transposase-like protein
MASSTLSAPHFHNEDAAFAYVEAHLWPHGPVCFHCKGTERIGKMNGKTTRAGLYKCYACKKPFTVRMGTIFESSHVPLRIWLQIIYLMCSSKKGISTRQIHRIIGGSLKTAWFLGHRIREAMKPGGAGPMGGPGIIVEADETEIVASPKTRRANRTVRSNNTRFVALVERNGEVRSKVIDERGMHQVRQAVLQNLEAGTILHTDGAQAYKALMLPGQHEAVDHKKGFARQQQRPSAYQHGRGLFQHLQARPGWGLPTDGRTAPAPVSG